MKYILFHAERPVYDDRAGQGAWNGFLSGTSSLKTKDADSKLLGEGAWLLVRDSEASILAQLVSAAEASRQKYTVTYLCRD